MCAAPSAAVRPSKWGEDRMGWLYPIASWVVYMISGHISPDATSSTTPMAWNTSLKLMGRDCHCTGMAFTSPISPFSTHIFVRVAFGSRSHVPSSAVAVKQMHSHLSSWR